MYSHKTPGVFLKTYFYSPHEIKFLKLNCREAFPYIDRMIICEFNRTHLGAEREYIFDRYIKDFSEEEQAKIIYLRCDVSKFVTKGSNSAQIHENEKLMRGFFINQIDLDNNDIVISVDADEIIHGRCYGELLDRISWFRKAIKLRLHQFFYKINYLWTNERFIAPTIAQVGYYRNKYPAQWRYDGQLFDKPVGSHFSWCMSIEEMINKLNAYAHHYDYRHLAKKEILEEAVQKRTYPFQPERDFNISVLNIEKDREYYPASIYSMITEFEDLIAPGWA